MFGVMSQKLHNFQESLKRSQAHAEAGWWLEVYRAAFPDLESAVCVRDDGWAQRGGVDRVLTLSSGKTLTVDEKVRSTEYDDILLEYWSDEKRRVRGWVAKDLACDFIAYAFEKSGRCYLLPFQSLRRAWRLNGRDWVNTYRRVEARNPGYVTVSVPVPTVELLNAVRDAMLVHWPSAA